MIVRLTGGLGNQMFQYAYGRAKSIEYKSRLKYYFKCYPGETIRKYELDIFNIKGKKIYGTLPDILVKISNLLRIKIPFIHYGYWQDEKYFNKYEDIIREDFRFRIKLNISNKEILDKIKKTNSVSIHIRRGDYVANKKILGLLPNSYYNNAIKLIKQKENNLSFFIFSDDNNWAKNKFKIPNAIYIDWNKGKDNYVDMYLMSKCKHNIIANSTFSWWGAWLNTNKNKIIIAPKRWFVSNEAYKNTINIVPKEWIKI